MTTRASTPPTPRQSERDVLVATLYQQGVPVAEIARRAEVCVKTVRNVARRFGLPPRNPSHPERDLRVAAMYAAGEKVATIAHKPTDVGWWLIGLLAADGSVNAEEQRVSLCQTLDDAGVLRAFYEYVGCSERPLTMVNLSETAQERQYPRRAAAEARIFSRRIVTALARHGVVPRKTATMRLSKEAASRPAVWLGILDGDGSVGVYRNGRDPRVRFFGTRELMEQCETFWRRSLRFADPTPAARPHRRGIWVFELSGRKASAAAAVLLAGSPISHERKRAKLLALVANSLPPATLSPSQTPSIV